MGFLESVISLLLDGLVETTPRVPEPHFHLGPPWVHPFPFDERCWRCCHVGPRLGQTDAESKFFFEKRRTNIMKQHIQT